MPDELSPFEIANLEAAEKWVEQGLITREVYDTLVARAKAEAFTVADLTLLSELSDVHGAILEAIEFGVTLDDFKASIDDLIIKYGWDHNRVNTIFRTNMQKAYHIGRYEQMMSVVNERPYWEYSAVMDRRTRPNHAANDGKIYPANSPFWDSWYPPNGFQCRCGVISHTEKEAKHLGIDKDFDKKKMPDKGFDINNGKELWGPDLKDYPKSLADEYDKKKKSR